MIGHISIFSYVQLVPRHAVHACHMAGNRSNKEYLRTRDGQDILTYHTYDPPPRERGQLAEIASAGSLPHWETDGTADLFELSEMYRWKFIHERVI